MPPLTARELDRRWERRFARSLEDLELLHASDGQLARRETKVRQARVRKQKKTRPCSTPKHSIGKRNDARAAYANDRAQLWEVLASDCGCALHAEGCYHAQHQVQQHAQHQVQTQKREPRQRGGGPAKQRRVT